jgi:hypothetical protein
LTDLLIYNDKIIRDKDLEITFHKDYVWIFNDESLPVVKFLLTNCRNLQSVDFDSIDYHNDGVTIEIYKEENRHVFETTDMGNRKVSIICDQIKREELEYCKKDFVKIIKEIQSQRDEMDERVTGLKKQIDNLKHLLNHELEIVDRKIGEATWLTNEKKNLLEGELQAFKKIIEAIERGERETALKLKETNSNPYGS